MERRPQCYSSLSGHRSVLLVFSSFTFSCWLINSFTYAVTISFYVYHFAVHKCLLVWHCKLCTFKVSLWIYQEINVTFSDKVATCVTCMVRCSQRYTVFFWVGGAWFVGSFFPRYIFSLTSWKIELPSGPSFVTFQLHDSQELAVCESHWIIGLEL